MSILSAQTSFNAIVRDNTTGAFTNGGRLAIHSLYPDEFEYYLMGFEVLNGGGVVVDRFVMPVLPENISINKRKIINIKKTSAGITSYQNGSFEPIQISISGTFGRRFKLMLGSKKKLSKVFQLNVKTGYGLAKELERIYEKHGKVDLKNRPYKFLFYNFAFNQSFIVEFNDVQFRQDQGNNVMWYYSLNMTAVAPADLVSSKLSRRKFLSIGFVGQQLNALGSDARSLIGGGLL